MIMLIMLINMLMIVIVDFQDPKSLQLLAGLVEAAMKSPLRGRFGNFSVFFFFLMSSQKECQKVTEEVRLDFGLI